MYCQALHTWTWSQKILCFIKPLLMVCGLLCETVMLYCVVQSFMRPAEFDPPPLVQMFVRLAFHVTSLSCSPRPLHLCVQPQNHNTL